MSVFEQAWSWVQQHPSVVWAATGASIGLLVLLLITLPIAVARLPEDWFLEDGSRREPEHPVSRVGLVIVRNVVGWIVLLAGVAMLALPGQGLLTILVGLLLVDLPGKRRMALRVVRRKGVHRWVRWIRDKAGEPPLQLPDE